MKEVYTLGKEKTRQKYRKSKEVCKNLPQDNPQVVKTGKLHTSYNSIQLPHSSEHSGICVWMGVRMSTSVPFILLKISIP